MLSRRGCGYGPTARAPHTPHAPISTPAVHRGSLEMVPLPGAPLTRWVRGHGVEQIEQTSATVEQGVEGEMFEAGPHTGSVTAAWPTTTHEISRLVPRPGAYAPPT